MSSITTNGANLTTMTEQAINTIVIAEREVQVKQPTETQLLLMGRSAKRAQAAAKMEQYADALYSMAEALDIIENLIISDEDRAFLVNLMGKGELEVNEIMEAIGNVSEVERAPSSVTRVTRARSRK